ncbi:LD-carboxypeptidase [Salicibibacter cibi]|uniref:LD-carboxypeptidase n=1 Tax=Salicibibacter cibi TaxID=2743001 RepID=A0A7T6ZDI4_9BACI|nr:S66 peptidase family protein [Salicibibacter cibi]QQK81504.1 LD-carboxypeptidase [Salicibibacter cibi]
MNFIAPSRLQSGDTVAVLSPSAGVPSLFPHIFDQGIQILKEEFGLNVKEWSTARADPNHLYHNPKERAENINEAFADPDIKAIISSIGGDDSVRILPYLEQEVIQKNPKIIMGFSDNTTFLTYCNQLGLVTFYGPTIMAGGISQLQGIGEEYKQHITDLLFNQNDGYEYKPFQYWSEGYPDWSDPENTGKINEQNLNSQGWNWLQGQSIKKGRLFGGNIEVFEMMKGTKYFPEDQFFDDKILFLENGEGTTAVNQIKRMLRSYGMKGVFDRIQGLMFGRARDYSIQDKEQLDNVLMNVIQDEFHQYDLPIISNMDFGHTDPFSILPMGTMAEIDCKQKRIILIESSVV